MMRDGRALQSATSHNFGQNFAEAFDIKYLDSNNELQFCWTTSWGLSTRVIGAVIMVHGDDQGLVLPPRLAPYQVVVVPIFKNDEEKAAVFAVVDGLLQTLAGLRVHVDRREGLTPGYKFNDWELRGVPVRLEVGPKDVAQRSAVLARRDRPGREGRQVVRQEGLRQAVTDLLDQIQDSMYARALEFRQAHTHVPKDFVEFKEIVEEGWADAWWCGDAACEAEIKEETKATIRCIPLDQQGGKGKCIHCGRPASERALFARAY
jgi:prolyl-tRNA synthetase